MKDSFLNKIYNLELKDFAQINSLIDDEKNFMNNEDICLVKKYLDAKKAFMENKIDKCLEISILPKLKNCEIKVLFYKLIADAYMSKLNYILAMTYYSKALSTSTEIQYTNFIGVLHFNIALVFSEVNEFEKSKEHITSALNYGIENDIFLSQISYIIEIYTNGVIKNPKKSIQNIIDHMTENKDDEVIKMFSHLFLIHLYSETQNYKKMLESCVYVYDNIEQNPKFTQHIDIMFILRNIVFTHFSLNNFNEVFKYYDISNNKFLYTNKNPFYYHGIILYTIRSLLSLNKVDEAMEKVSFSFDYENNPNKNIQNGFVEIIDIFKKKLFAKKDIILNIKDIENFKNESCNNKSEFKKFHIDNERFELISSFSEKISKSKTFVEAYEVSAIFVSKIFNFDIFTISHFDEKKEFLYNDFLHFSGNQIRKNNISIENYPFINKIIETKEKIIINSLSSEYNCNNTIANYFQSESIIMVPLLDHGNIFGVSSLQSSSFSLYDDIDLEMFDSFCSILSGELNLIYKREIIKKIAEEKKVFKNKLLNAKMRLKDIEYRDSLTSFFKKDMIEIVAKNNIEVFIKNQVHIVMIDINNFSSYNKKYGRIQGDLYLIKLKDLIKANFSTNSKIFRLEGDTFLVFEFKYTQTNILNNLEKINTALNEFVHNTSNKKQIRYELQNIKATKINDIYTSISKLNKKIKNNKNTEKY